MPWYIHIADPDGAMRFYRLPEDMDPVSEEAIAAARSDAGMPAEEDGTMAWFIGVNTWPPHRKTLAKATVIDWTAGVPD